MPAGLLQTGLNAEYLNGNAASYYATAADYVPYTGATTDMNLGANKLITTTSAEVGFVVVAQNGFIRVQAKPTDPMIFNQIDGTDDEPRFSINGNGDWLWGDGSNPADTNLYRSAANILKTDDTFDAAGYKVGGAAGVSGTFTTVDLKTVTVTNGLITGIA